MKKTIPIAAALAAIIFQAPPAFAAAEQRFRYQPEPDFHAIVETTIASFQARDVFLAVAECRVADVKPIMPFPIAKAIEMLTPCVESLSHFYAAGVELQQELVKVEPGPDGAPRAVLAIAIVTDAPLGTELLRDLGHSLAARNGLLLGHPAMLRRREPKMPLSLAQEALDRCMLPTILRKVESASDFVRFYGQCLLRAPELAVREIRPSESDRMSVTLRSAADRATIQGLNGLVSVSAENGPVHFTLFAYPEDTYLP